MSDQFVELNAGTGGAKMDSEQLTVGANTVQRARTRIAGLAAAALAVVTNTIPALSDYGLVTRAAGYLAATNPTAGRTSITTADGTTAPAVNDSNWVVNPGGARRVRHFLTVDFTGGTSPSASIRLWTRSGDSTNGKVGKGPIYVLEEGQFCIDQDVDFDDFNIRVEEITGGPSSTDIDTWYSFRSGG